ncbi:hypothetical protein A3K48_07895 [candidate division WOR-1 bacterium RIFOXYA12_FULL_52_29]|uniref:Uncharacterized protein n=1 Tax=candidate division WOR-1 bacterium RIFOXYC12_FULL_54_18 TaxID=1802584 RepID=A0A1F4T8L1_UNCSA|nr:MAG: hypothetical protein A3K44_07895 [candidate division WOR-1 bacterium RIFOXYA2_FULL_51_19]OGC18433.1 MAG: hypothetical protein A3K48_07895 [candidate division WOR-1 bacterium RIFOXYA12_FULL_52_29]OGC27287.1 MAG: hypothetical protein A3K32_07890 [candidate division WOR-1 bacterium RIFOXYB2_FULL_45_9]OGC28850.1 MAG: hypothetical protein A3K49_07895 [candidate division WOR-1 bacterium RIFOXYC12_FULL_54_18]OGC30641.1 MAG: hypothetical protein A2346_00080 [candidate division WOR-1 bacterium R
MAFKGLLQRGGVSNNPTKIRLLRGHFEGRGFLRGNPLSSFFPPFLCPDVFRDPAKHKFNK